MYKDVLFGLCDISDEETVIAGKHSFPFLSALKRQLYLYGS